MPKHTIKQLKFFLFSALIISVLTFLILMSDFYWAGFIQLGSAIGATIYFFILLKKTQAKNSQDDQYGRKQAVLVSLGISLFVPIYILFSVLSLTIKIIFLVGFLGYSGWLFMLLYMERTNMPKEQDFHANHANEKIISKKQMKQYDRNKKLLKYTKAGKNAEIFVTPKSTLSTTFTPFAKIYYEENQPHEDKNIKEVFLYGSLDQLENLKKDPL